MKRAILLLALICPAVGLAAPPPSEQGGAYACIAHRVVGLQNSESGERYAGKIKLRTEQQNFLITISRLPTPRTGTQARLCSEFKFESAYREYWNCKTSFGLKFSKGKADVLFPLRGESLSSFRSEVLLSSFWLMSNLTYVYHRHTLGKVDFNKEPPRVVPSNYYVEEGICQKMEVPK